uniref:NADH-ubiquinone oxidoreductase chain 6 n=1 Tax=Florometra sp. BMK-2020 TaxID=2719553 RepID=A0A6M8TY94_9ECHI|nr:NADH dehydrogenase subunit 6 [Florometra sp. BMK-2020]
MNTFFLLIINLFGSSLVFYSISPYFSALGLVTVSISSCLLLSYLNINFLALILLLVYMGGMLIVFIYSSALTNDRFPQISNINEIALLSLFFLIWTNILINNENWISNNNNNITNSINIEGTSYLFHQSLAIYFILSGYILLITLIAVLNISSNNEYSSLRAI